MASTAQLRRTWFALLRERGIQDEDRHDVQEALTGKASTRAWTPGDYDQAIARLQRDAGVHHDQHAHLRTRRPGQAPEPGQMATAAQADLVEDLADRIAWRVGRERGPLAFLLRSVLKGPTAELRRETLRARWAEGARGGALWAGLFRREAAIFIRALRKEEAACLARSA